MCNATDHTCSCGTSLTIQHRPDDAAVTETFGVSGMTCSHCVSAVTQELSGLAGVQNVSVDLVAGGVSQVRVASERALDPDQVAAAIDEAGYELADQPR